MFTVHIRMQTSNVSSKQNKLIATKSEPQMIKDLAIYQRFFSACSYHLAILDWVKFCIAQLKQIVVDNRRSDSIGGSVDPWVRGSVGPWVRGSVGL